MRPRARLSWLFPLALAACEDDPPPTTPTPGATPGGAGGATPGGPGAPTAGRGQGDAGRSSEPQPPRREIHEGMFLENQGRRDPFRTFWAEFTSTIIERADDRDVRLGNFAIDDLRLVAVVVGTDNPYAMVIDPTRAGTILRRGMYIGRQEVIHSNRADTPDYPVHWRIARITGGRLRRLPDGTFEEIPAMVVLERPDPLNPGAPVVERPMTLVPRALTPGTQTATGLGTTGAATNSTAFLPPSPGGPPLLGGAPQPGPMPPGVTTQVFNYTTPGQPTPAPAPTTVVVQPQAPAAQGPQAPSNAPPPIQVTGPGAGSLPSHGLGGP